jgi:RHS repeat-associated protein
VVSPDGSDLDTELDVEQQRYLPFGGARTISGSLSITSTDFTYTGQRNLPGTGLMDYKARFYSPYINRFVQPDTIIPSLSNPQSWNRFSYVTNRPINFNDPSGHIASCDEYESCKTEREFSKLNAKDSWKKIIKDKFGVVMSDGGVRSWSLQNLRIMYSSLRNIDNVLKGNLKSFIDGATFEMERQSPPGQYHGSTHLDGSGIDFFTIGDQAVRQMNIYHEVGHLLDNVPGLKDVFTNEMESLDNPSFVDGPKGGIVSEALKSQTIYNDPNYASVQARQTYSNGGPSEQWADAFANYVAGNIDLASIEGYDMNNFVKGALAPYINPTRRSRP